MKFIFTSSITIILLYGASANAQCSNYSGTRALNLISDSYIKASSDKVTGEAIMVKRAVNNLFKLKDSNSNNIHFEKGLSWKEIRAKAKAQRKYIFVDCYATWCKPCKLMEKDVYPKLNDTFNNHFISIKVQIDKNKHDNEQVKAWYRDAALIQSKYNVKAFPTFLFFSPEGKIVHRGIGYKNEHEFMNLASNALVPNNQYYSLLANRKKRDVNYLLLKELALNLRIAGDLKSAKRAALIYFNNYLLSLEDVKLYTKDNIDFVNTFIEQSKGKFFDFFYYNGSKIDKVMGLRYSESVITRIIYNEEIYPVLKKAVKINKSPSWIKLKKTITRKHDASYASRLILDGQISWYGHKKEFPIYAKTVVEKMEKYGSTLLPIEINQYAFKIFLVCTDSSILNKALFWCDSAINTQFISDKANHMDTKASLLYKLGRKEDAITLEEEALKLAIDNQNEFLIKSFQNNLAKMKMDKVTWSVE
jgi:thioredoxin-related protein